MILVFRLRYKHIYLESSVYSTAPSQCLLVKPQWLLRLRYSLNVWTDGSQEGWKQKSMCMRLQRSECHLFFIPRLLWDPRLGAGGLGATCTFGQIQHPAHQMLRISKCSAWRSAASGDRHLHYWLPPDCLQKNIAAISIIYPGNIDDLSWDSATIGDIAFLAFLSGSKQIIFLVLFERLPLIISPWEVVNDSKISTESVWKNRSQMCKMKTVLHKYITDTTV